MGGPEVRDDTADALMAPMTWRSHSLLSIVDLKGGNREEISQSEGKTGTTQPPRDTTAQEKRAKNGVCFSSATVAEEFNKWSQKNRHAFASSIYVKTPDLIARHNCLMAEWRVPRRGLALGRETSTWM